MNTTENTYGGADQPKTASVVKDDVKALKAAYVKGATIDDLALEYGYSARQVEDIVVSPVEPDTQPTQASQPVAETKKGK